ncbi:MAG: hypothetical protein AAF676_01890 [Pseudomonadota bacterium]
MQALWEFLTVEENRAVLQWLGGGLMVVCGAAWGVLKSRGAAAEGPATGPAGTATRPAPLTLFALLLAATLGLAAVLAAAFAGGEVTVEDGVGIGGDAAGTIIINSP